MATGQTLLNLMELVNAELQLQSGEADVTKGLRALNAAQDHFEMMAAIQPGIFGGQVGTVATAQSTESTAFPTGFLRVDALQGLENSLPAWSLDPIERTGGHARRGYWPYNLLYTSSTGKPSEYWTNGTNIYWSPIPDAVYSIRVYGYKSADDITASGTFAYPDGVMLPLATFAARLMKAGVDDDATDLDRLATALFGPVLDALSNFQREGPTGFQYEFPHDT